MRESVTAQHEAGDFYSLGAAVRSFSRQGASAVRDGVMADVRALHLCETVTRGPLEKFAGSHDRR